MYASYAKVTIRGMRGATIAYTDTIRDQVHEFSRDGQIFVKYRQKFGLTRQATIYDNMGLAGKSRIIPLQ